MAGKKWVKLTKAKRAQLNAENKDAYYDQGDWNVEPGQCCGVSEFNGLQFIPVRNNDDHFAKLIYLFAESKESACVIATDTRRRRDLEVIGFKLARKPFRNYKTNNTIWMYTGLIDVITGKTDE